MKTIYFLRHGQAHEYLPDEGKYPGPELTELGHAQAELANRVIIKHTAVSRIWCSDMTRAMQTASHLSLDVPISYHRELCEVNKVLFEREAGDEEKYRTNRRRAARAWKVMRDDILASRYRDVLIVGHGTCMNYLIGRLLGLSLAKMPRLVHANCGLTKIEVGGARPKFEYLSLTTHIPKDKLSW